MQQLIGAFLIACAFTVAGDRDALAAAKDYVFEATKANVKQGSDAIVAVRLLNTTSGEAVANAVIFQMRLDMSPDNMGGMTSKVTPVASDEPGVYRFKVDLTMAGRWALKLAAKVPGEPETVRGEVIVVAAE
ncbi:MAG: FixH family protein [Rhodospirillales bacterium]|uniref:FixH family protein n=1 Tax=Accumulibacter sp. TaxID=2053492 RepID=UPI001DF9361F|nr:FixH family protein [Accumulibacter sp.]MBX3517481.1 FixH family protein [Rhodospirillales bacterium]MCM8627139.1 FixH family protein [Accumulibacter sp.]